MLLLHASLVTALPPSPRCISFPIHPKYLIAPNMADQSGDSSGQQGIELQDMSQNNASDNSIIEVPSATGGVEEPPADTQETLTAPPEPTGQFNLSYALIFFVPWLGGLLYGSKM